MSKEILGRSLASAMNSSFSDGSVYTSATPDAAASVIGQTITTYILQHVRVSASYVGVIPGTPPVPEAGSDSMILPVGTCPPPLGRLWDSWVAALESSISGGFLTGSGPVIHPITPGRPFILPVSLKMYISQDSLKSAHTGNLGDPLEAVWIAVAGGICDWITQGPPVVPTYPAGMVGTGVATIIKNIII